MFKVHHDSLKSPHQYPDAGHAEVTDSGHLVLLVQSTNPREVVAVYAPGSWIRAEYVKPAAS